MDNPYLVTAYILPESDTVDGSKEWRRLYANTSPFDARLSLLLPNYDINQHLPLYHHTVVAMSSSVSSHSSLSSAPQPVQIGYIECYKGVSDLSLPDLDRFLIIDCTSVLYSPGEKHKPGNRSWHDGLLIYYTINKKVSGHLVAASWIVC